MDRSASAACGAVFANSNIHGALQTKAYQSHLRNKLLSKDFQQRVVVSGYWNRYTIRLQKSNNK